MSSTRMAASPPAIRAWRAVGPAVIGGALLWRWARGRETWRSIRQRLVAVADRAPWHTGANVVWFHSASTGECKSVLCLVREVLGRDDSSRVIMTLATTTALTWLSAAVEDGEVDGVRADRVAVRLAPVDTSAAVSRFLSRWKPDCAVFVESELWPIMIDVTAATGCPMLLVNGRMSPSTFAAWSTPVARQVVAAMLARFALVSAQDDAQRELFSRLGAHAPREAVGNLKWASAGIRSPPQHGVRQWLGLGHGRVAWLAMSTHPGETGVILDTHEACVRALGSTSLRTLVMSRHPHLSGDLVEAARRRGLRVSLHSTCAPETDPGLDPSVDVYVVDAMGLVPLFAKAVDVVALGGSWAPGVGGHNPLEALREGCPVLVGPWTQGVASTVEAIRKTDPRALVVVPSAAGLPGELARMLNPAARDELSTRSHAAREVAERLHAQVLETAMRPICEALKRMGEAKLPHGPSR